jgi:glycosyltransferase involved in cell wall biosynthesis
MSDDYVLIAMGKGGGEYEKLKKEYGCDRILFVPFVRPPYHLLVTEMASVCVLSYFPSSETLSHTVNPIYCAPNKIFEYAKFGKPMISNDIPGLYYPFKIYNCGRCIKYPMSAEHVKGTLQEIFDNYDELSKGAIELYYSVDIKKIVAEIVNS